MEPRHLWTLKWTQPYTTQYSNDFMAELHALYLELVEASIDEGNLDEANEVIDRIKSL